MNNKIMISIAMAMAGTAVVASTSAFRVSHLNRSLNRSIAITTAS